MNEVKRILVVVTATNDCEDLVRDAFGLAERMRANLFVLDVVHDPFAYMGWNLPMPSFDKEYRRLLDGVRDRLRAMIKEAKGKGFPIESLVREGQPFEQIVKVIEEEKIELLVLPAHEEHRLEHYFTGRLMDKLIRKMPCSILLVKQEDVTLCET
ncbi:MAG: universal stress protein [Syntrophorhabdales bacterium]|jgi:nucleotide-binding universal stress UspA family protein